MKVKYCKVLVGNEFYVTSEWLTNRGDFLGYRVLDVKCCKLFKKYRYLWYGHLEFNNYFKLSFVRGEVVMSEINYCPYCASKVELEYVGVKYLYREEFVYTEERRKEREKLLDK